MRTAMSFLLVLIVAAAAVVYFAGRSRATLPVSTTPLGGGPPGGGPTGPASNPPPAPTPEPPQPGTEKASNNPPPLDSGARPVQPPAADDKSGGQAERWTEVEKKVLELTNVERTRAGLPPLAGDDGLHLCARFQSADMLTRHFFDHVNPSGEDPSQRIGRLDRRLVGTAGENIWEGTGSSFVSNPDLADVIVKAWMASPHHRENILRPEFTHLGVGVVIENNEVRATQNFSHMRAALTADLPESVSSGIHLKLETTSPGSPATMYALQPEGSSAKPTPAPIDKNVVTAPPGKYRVQFYFPDKNGFLIFNGPQLTMR